MFDKILFWVVLVWMIGLGVLAVVVLRRLLRETEDWPEGAEKRGPASEPPPPGGSEGAPPSVEVPPRP